MLEPERMVDLTLESHLDREIALTKVVNLDRRDKQIGELALDTMHLLKYNLHKNQKDYIVQTLTRYASQRDHIKWQKGTLAYPLEQIWEEGQEKNRLLRIRKSRLGIYLSKRSKQRFIKYAKQLGKPYSKLTVLDILATTPEGSTPATARTDRHLSKAAKELFTQHMLGSFYKSLVRYAVISIHSDSYERCRLHGEYYLSKSTDPAVRISYLRGVPEYELPEDRRQNDNDKGLWPWEKR